MLSLQVPDRGRNWGVHGIGVPRQEDSERGASWRVQVAELKWLTQNIFTISSQGARRWVDPVTENTSQLTGCSLCDTNSEMFCSFAGEAAKGDANTFVENETHQVLWRPGGGRRQESLQGAHILLEPSGLRFFKMNGKKIHIRMSFEFKLFTIPSPETCSAPRRVEVTQAWPHEPVSWARLLKNLSAKERLGGWSSYQIG